MKFFTTVLFIAGATYLLFRRKPLLTGLGAVSMESLNHHLSQEARRRGYDGD